MEISKHIRDSLKEMGFTDYESSIYITLVTEGSLNAKTLSSLSKVPYSRIYQVIQTLSEKEFIIRDEDSRPTLYSASPPLDALKAARKRYFDEVDKKTKFLFDELNPIYLMKTIPKKLDLYQLEGKEHCLIKMEKIANKSKKSVYVATNQLDVLEALYPVLEKLRLKGMSDIKVLIENDDFELNFRASDFFKGYMKIAELRRTSKVFGTMLVIDQGEDSFLLYEKQLMSDCIFTGVFSETPLIGNLAASYYDFLFNTSEKISRPKRKLTKVKIF